MHEICFHVHIKRIVHLFISDHSPWWKQSEILLAALGRDPCDKELKPQFNNPRVTEAWKNQGISLEVDPLTAYKS